MNAQGRLISRYTKNLPNGELCWIGLRTERRGLVEVTERANAIAGLGLEGDRRCQGTAGSARQVTLISQEYIEQICHFMHKDHIDPALLRCNLVVKGINLYALRHQRFQIGSTIFEATAWCHPCSRMEEVLGEGAVAAMLGHGGLCAKILQGGSIKVGDTVIKLPNED